MRRGAELCFGEQAGGVQRGGYRNIKLESPEAEETGVRSKGGPAVGLRGLIDRCLKVRGPKRLWCHLSRG